MAVDLARVRFRPSELVEASGRVREAAPSLDDRVGRAVARTIAAFVEWAEGLVERRELELRQVVRREVPDAGGGGARRAVEAVRLEDSGEVEAAARRLARALRAPFQAGDERGVREVLERKRQGIEALHARAEVRAVRAAETELAWATVPRPTA